MPEGDRLFAYIVRIDDEREKKESSSSILSFHRHGAPRPRGRIGIRPVGRGASPLANPYS